MKPFIIFSLLLMHTGLLAQQNDLLPEKLVISYPVFFSDYNLELNYRFRNSLVLKNEQYGEDFIGIRMAKKVVKDKLAVYEPYMNTYYPYSVFESEKMSPRIVKESLGYRSDTLASWTEDSGNEEYRITEIDYSEIKSLYFTEEWYFDGEAFSFSKDLIAVSPIREYYRETGFGEASKRFSKTFRILYPDNLGFFKKRRSERNMKICNSVAYECLLIEGEQLFYNNATLEVSNAPFLTSYSREKLFRSIIEPVLSGKRQAYSYPDNNELKVNRAEKALGLKTDTIYTIDPMSGESMILTAERVLDYHEFKSIVFFEDWYYDSETSRMKKTVKALAPVRHYYAEDDFDRETPLKQIVFKVYLK
jgi:hypothetical protein